MSETYQREPERQWRSAVDAIYKVEDQRERAIALLQHATGVGAGFLSLADTGLPEWTPDVDREGWADFFEHAAAEDARKLVHGAANSAFLSLSLEEKLQALSSLPDERIEVVLNVAESNER